MAVEEIQQPGTIHQKDTISISVRTIQREERDDDVKEQSAGRRMQAPQPLKTNTGKPRAAIQLLPQPSESFRDPLNWPAWKKELTFISVMFSFATGCVLKTVFVPTNRVIATQFGVSYLSAAALTGVPFIMSAISGTACAVCSEIIGKRMIYLLSGVLMLIGALWSMHVESSYAWLMVSRCVQGLGWGGGESLFSATIRDIYFVYQRPLRMDIMNITGIVFTWGSPVLGGYLSQSHDGFREALMILTIIQAFSVPMLILFAPETTFDRSTVLSSTHTRQKSLGGTTIIRSDSPPLKTASGSFLSSLHPLPYHSTFCTHTALRLFRALGAPTTLLTFLTTFPLVATAFALAHSLSLLFSSMPTFLFPARLGYILSLPATIALLVYCLAAIMSRLHVLTRSSVATIAPGIIIGSSGLLALGLYISGGLMPKMASSGRAFPLGETSEGLSMTVVSALLGMVVAGGALLILSSSSSLSSSTMPASIANVLPMESAHQMLLNTFIGIFVIAAPAWIQMSMASEDVNPGMMMMMGLKDTCVGIAVVQILAGSSAAAALWVKRKNLEKIDERVVGTQRKGVEGSIELKKWRTNSSYFDA